MKQVYAGGLYDTWSSAGGDVRKVEYRRETIHRHITGQEILVDSSIDYT